MEPNDTKTFISDPLRLNVYNLCPPPRLTRGGPTISKSAPIVLLICFER